MIEIFRTGSIYFGSNSESWYHLRGRSFKISAFISSFPNSWNTFGHLPQLTNSWVWSLQCRNLLVILSGLLFEYLKGLFILNWSEPIQVNLNYNYYLLYGLKFRTFLSPIRELSANYSQIGTRYLLTRKTELHKLYLLLLLFG